MILTVRPTLTVTMFPHYFAYISNCLIDHDIGFFSVTVQKHKFKHDFILRFFYDRVIYFNNWCIFGMKILKSKNGLVNRLAQILC